MLAICPNNNEIHIYGSCNTESWTKLFVLAEVNNIIIYYFKKILYIKYIHLLN